MPRLLTCVILVLALTATLAEAKSQRLEVTAKIVQTTFTGDLTSPKLGDQLISSVVLFNKHDKAEKVGTGAGVCTIVSVPPPPQPPNPDATFLQCLLTAEFAKGQILFGGVAPLPQPGIVATFGIVGGTDDFRKAGGEAMLTVLSPTLQDAVFDLD